MGGNGKALVMVVQGQLLAARMHVEVHGLTRKRCMVAGNAKAANQPAATALAEGNC